MSFSADTTWAKRLFRCPTTTAFSNKPCRNLDLILSGHDWIKESFHCFGGQADLALVEGVMGLFDVVGIEYGGVAGKTNRDVAGMLFAEIHFTRPPFLILKGSRIDFKY